MDKFDHVIGRIYDCAANPDLWPDTLSQIRDMAGAAYVMTSLVDMSALASGGAVTAVRRFSPWNENWLNRLDGILQTIPGGGALFAGGVDLAWTQMTQLPEADFHQTEFYQDWVAPQGLRDCMTILPVQRQTITGFMTAPSYRDRALYAAEDCLLFERLSPHIRRAMLINDMVDKGKLALALYRKVLDSLSVAVFVTSFGRRLAFANASGEAMLSDGNFIGLAGGVLNARRVAGAPTALDVAIDQAAKGDGDIGLKGIGVPLIGADGDRAAAYVLPISGNDLRGAMGQGHAAVFIARRGEQQPMAVEILRTVFDLTPAEARVASLLAKGDSPALISEALGISINTVRSHLAQCFAKSGTADQTALAATINALMPPVMTNG